MIRICLLILFLDYCKAAENNTRPPIEITQLQPQQFYYDQSASERLIEREKGRKKQGLGVTVEEYSKGVSQLSKLTAILGGVTDPMIKSGAQGVTAAISALGYIGMAAGRILTAYGRYQERINQVLSAHEQLLEEISKTQESIDESSKLIEELIDPITLNRIAGLKTKDGRQVPLKKKIQLLFSASTYKSTFQQLADKTYLTNYKEENWKQIQQHRERLVQAQNYLNDLKKLLSIKIMQDAVKDLEARENVEQTIKTLESNLKFNLDARDQIDDKLTKWFLKKNEKQAFIRRRSELDTIIINIQNDIKYFKKEENHIKNNLNQIKTDRKMLIERINELSRHTNLRSDEAKLKRKYEKASMHIGQYLKEKGMDENYIKEIKSVLNSLTARIEAIDRYLKINSIQLSQTTDRDLKINSVQLSQTAKKPEEKPLQRQRANVLSNIKDGTNNRTTLLPQKPLPPAARRSTN